MIVNGYAATAEDLCIRTSGGLKIDSKTGMLPNAARRHRLENPELLNRLSNTINVRPGLKEAICFYGVMQLNGKMLIAVSDRHQTRYYCLGQTPRETIMVDLPSKSHDEALGNMIKGVLSQDSQQGCKFYKAASDFIKAYFISRGPEWSVCVEGKSKTTKEDFVASVEWSRWDRDAVEVSSTLDEKRSRKVSLWTHPIAEVHKICAR